MLATSTSELRDQQRDLIMAISLEIRSTAAIAGQFPDLFMPQSGSSMTSSNLLGLLDLLFTIRPKFVLELGSGISTLLIAAWMKRHGDGQLISLDHDPFWAEQSRTYLRMHGLDDYACVRVAPLGPMQFGTVTISWYDVEGPIAEIRGVDLLVVDGPPSRPGQMTRWPALPALYNRLSDNATIFVDDGNRQDERAMIEAWGREFVGLSSRYIATLTGYWILRTTSLTPLGNVSETSPTMPGHAHIIR